MRLARILEYVTQAAPTCLLALTSIGLVACAAAPCETAEPEDADSSVVEWTAQEAMETIAEAKEHEANAPAPDPHADLSEEERTDKARTLFGEAEAHAEAGEWMEAKTKYEEAYHLVPNRHGLAYRVANAAVEVGDCEKARIFFEHFLMYGDISRHEALLHSALAKHRALECTLG